MNSILKRHESVRALFDNRWFHLFATDDEGRLAQRYVGDLNWEVVEPSASVQNLEAVA